MKRHTIPLLLCTSIAAILLCGVTISRCLESYRTLKGFTVILTGVTPSGLAERTYRALLTFQNQGTAPATLETLHAALYFDKRLIGATSIEPRGLVVPAGGKMPFTIEIVSNLEEQSLPRVSHDPSQDPWRIRLHLRLGLPDRHDSFRLDFEKKLGD